MTTICPKFKYTEIVVAGKAFDLHYRNVIEYVKALFGDPKLVPHLLLAPGCHYVDADQTIHQYCDIHTEWNIQKKTGRRKA